MEGHAILPAVDPSREAYGECVELAPALAPLCADDSGSKLHALHTLRDIRSQHSNSENPRRACATRRSPKLDAAPDLAPSLRLGRPAPEQWPGKYLCEHRISDILVSCSFGGPPRRIRNE